MQFESANRGNVVMQIWLGKQHLGQSDHALDEIRRVPSFTDLTLDELGQGLNEYIAMHPEFGGEVKAIEADFEVLPKPANQSLPTGSGDGK